MCNFHIKCDTRGDLLLCDETEGAVAGATAGVVVEAALYPIDTIKTRLQVTSFWHQFQYNVMIKFLSKELESSCREGYVELFWVHCCWIHHLWGFVLVYWLAGITIRREGVVWRTLFRSCRQSCWCFAVRNHPSFTLESILLGMWLFLLLIPFCFRIYWCVEPCHIDISDKWVWAFARLYLLAIFLIGL